MVSFTYHPRGWLLSQTLGEGAGASTTTYGYDPAGNLIRVTPPSGATLDFTYDAANRLTAITDAQGNVQRYTLDAMGNRVGEQTEDPQGGITQQLSRVYNSLNRLQQQIGADPTRTQHFAYDANGNLTGTTDALSRTTTSGYDALDRLISQLDPANGQTGFAYDARDNLTAVTDPRGNTTAYGYNAFDERITQTSPDTGNTTYTYDEAGNLTRQTDARGITVTYTYDALNRLTAVHYPDPSLTVTYIYDQGTHGLGRLSQMTDAAGTTDYRYDLRGNLISETRTDGPLITTITYAYDNADRLVTLGYPSGHQVHYAYDAVGQVSTVTLERPDASTQILADNLQYLPFGPLKAMTYGNGLSLSRSYDLDYRLVGQHIPGLLDDAYAINAVDNLTAWYDGLDPTRDQSFDYDALDRLITAQGSYGDLGYTYDANGNRLSRTQDLATDTYLIDLASNRLTEIQGGLGDLFSYDAAGNITASAQGEFGYDDSNRLVSYSAPGITARYAYNGQGERVSKTVNGLTTRFRYANSQLMGEYDDSGNAIREYVYLNAQPLAVIERGSDQGGGTPSTPPPVEPPPPIDFSQHTFEAYAPAYQTIDGNVTVRDGGATVQLRGNLWQRIALPSTITPDTLLTFDFYSDSGGEVHAIGFDNDQYQSNDQLFQVYGSQPVGRAVNTYAGGGWQTYSLPVGSYLSGTFSHLIFVMDDDAAAAGDSRFRHVRIYDDPAAPKPVAGLDLNAYPLSPYDPLQDVGGSATIDSHGTTLKLVGNTWKKLAIPHTVTADTVLEFEFFSSVQGEIHAIGLDDDNALSPERFFQLYGTQSWGHPVTPQYATGDWQPVRIPVGQYFTGSFPYLVFAMDDDAAVAGESRFRHIRFTEGASPQPGASDGIYYAHTDHLGAIRRLSDENAALVWDAERLPFGELNLQTAQVELPLRFPGQYYDDESGLHYNYFRDYDPTTGRYIQSDPIGLEGGLNTYLYANANPLRYTDPYGQSPVAGATWGGNIGTAIGTPFGGPVGAGIGRAIGSVVGAGIGYGIASMCDDEEEECLEEIQDCMETCRTARNNKHRMRDIWGGSWWRCMTGCVSFECQDYLNERDHGEY